jgi:uncharacterized membrane protein
MNTWNRALKRALGRRRREGALPIAAAAGLGVGAMYLADPDRGARRRALVHDKILHVLHRAAEVFGKAARDFDARAHGVVAESKSVIRDGEVQDDVLVARVRSKMGRVVQHPHAVHVEAHAGRVTLSGPILAEDVGPLLARAAAVPGVHEVENRLDVHESPEGVSSLQGRSRRPGAKRPWVREQWSPVARVAAAAIATGLVAEGARRKGRGGRTLEALGAALLVRDVANRSLRRLLGVGAGREAVEIQKTITVDAPVPDVFELYSDFERFPRFMSHVIQVEKLGEGRYRWVVKGPLGIPVSWDAEITELVPERVVAWKSEPGALIGNAGIVHFDPAPEGGTRIDLKMVYNPPGGAVGHAIASLFGVDPKHALDVDLVRFQSLLERGKTTAHGEEVRFADIAEPSSR